MQELLNGTLAEAIEKLASFAVVRQTQPQTYREKVAASATDILSSLGDTVKDNPALSHALIGGGVGAGIGGLGTALSNRKKPSEERRGVLGSMFAGGLAGAGVGAGIGLGRTGLSNLKSPGGLGGSGIGTDALQPGQFIDPETGQKMLIDPQALKDNPNLAAEIRHLAKPTTQTVIAGGAGEAWKQFRERTPWSSSVLPFVGAADLALHAPGIGLARTTADRVGGYYGKKWFNSGAQANAHLSETAKKMIDANAELGTDSRFRDTTTEIPGTAPKTSKGNSWLSRLFNNKVLGRDRGIAEILGGRANKAHDIGTDPAIHFKTETPEFEDVIKRKFAPQPAGPQGEIPPVGALEEERTVRAPKLDADKKPLFKKETETLNKKQIGDFKIHGSEADPHFKDRSIFRVPGTNKVYRGMSGAGAAAKLRLGLYGAPLAAEYLARGIKEDQSHKETIREIMARHAKPVKEN